jgi:hypothetical protein
MAELEESLSRLRDHPPNPPRPLADVAARGARIRARRQRTLAVALTGFVVMATIGVVAVADRSPRRTRVDTVQRPHPGRTTTSGTSPGAVQPKLVVTPAIDLVDGQTVKLRFFGAGRGTSAQVSICPKEAVRADKPESLCDTSIGGGNLDEEPGGISYKVRRVVVNGDVRTDCASAPGRCVIGARLAPSGGDVFGFVDFRGSQAPPPKPKVLVRGTVDPAVDGVYVAVEGSSFLAGDDVSVAVCRRGDLPQGDACDLPRSRNLTADRVGRALTYLRLYREILTNRGWHTCTDDCELRLIGHRSGTASASLRFTGNTPGIRPIVRITTRGPYRPGQRVTLEGTGFQRDDRRVQVERCALPTDSKTRGCDLPLPDMAIRTDANGSFTVKNYPLPSSSDLSCTAHPGTCHLTWHPGEGTPDVFSVPLDLSG